MPRELDIPVDVPFQRLTDEQVHRLLEGVPGSGFTGLKAFFEGLERQSYKLRVRVFLSRWRRYQTCPGCHGARLRPEALAVKIEGRDIAGLSALTIREARRYRWRGLAPPAASRSAASILAQVDSRLGYLAEIGLDYLTLDRPARTSRPASSSASADQDPGLRPGQHPVRARRAHARPPSARSRPADRDPAPPARPAATRWWSSSTTTT